MVEDSVGDLEQIYRPDIITDADDADNEINVRDPVIALHPSFPYSYAPGMRPSRFFSFFFSRNASSLEVYISVA